MTTGARIVDELRHRGPLEDSKLARLLGFSHQQVNQAARQMEAQGLVVRAKAEDEVLRNELTAASATTLPGGGQPSSWHRPCLHRRDLRLSGRGLPALPRQDTS